MQVTSPKALAGQIQGLLDGSDEAALSKEKKAEACLLARKLWLELVEQGDLVDQIVFQPQENALMQVAFDLGIYKTLAESKIPVSAEDLARKTKCDVVLMRRILRTLAALDHLQEVGADLYAANNFTLAFNTPKGYYMNSVMVQWARTLWQEIPEWLKSMKYQNPSDHMHTAFHRAYGDDQSFFPFLAQRGFLESFQGAMTEYRTDRAEFLDVYPAEERLLAGSDDKGPMLVDVGGGHGHELKKFEAKFPQTKGRNILQDQPDVVAGVTASDAFEATAHDFFTPQPVQGARAYYFRLIFHDWPDPSSLEILKQTASAMKKGYSKLIVNDIVFPAKGATRYAAQSDINMMSLFASVERSELHWRQLLEEAGLRVVKIFIGVPESVIEAELA